MKRRRVLVLALVALAAPASAAYAADLMPTTGPWKGTAADSDEAVSFKLEKAGNGYRAASTRALVVAPCQAPNPNDSTAVRVIRARGVTVKLGSDGRRLRGTRKLTTPGKGGKSTQTVSIAVSVISERRAKVVVKARYATKRANPTSNSDNCSGRLAVTAKPK